MANSATEKGANHATDHKITIKLIMLIAVLTILKVEESICRGRLLASRFAFSSFS